MSKLSITLFLFLSSINLIKFSTRLNSKKCIYTLKIEFLEKSENIIKSEDKIKIKFDYSETFELFDNREKEKKLISEKITSQVKINFTEKDFSKHLDIVEFNKYKILLDSKILYFKKLNINMSKNEFYFNEKNDFFYEIENLPCELELPLVKFKRNILENKFPKAINNLFMNEDEEDIEEEVSVNNNITFFFDVTSLNKFHLEKNGFEIEEFINGKNYSKFRSFEDQVM